MNSNIDKAMQYYRNYSRSVLLKKINILSTNVYICIYDPRNKQKLFAPCLLLVLTIMQYNNTS